MASLISVLRTADVILCAHFLSCLQYFIKKFDSHHKNIINFIWFWNTSVSNVGMKRTSYFVPELCKTFNKFDSYDFTCTLPLYVHYFVIHPTLFSAHSKINLEVTFTTLFPVNFVYAILKILWGFNYVSELSIFLMKITHKETEKIQGLLY